MTDDMEQVNTEVLTDWRTKKYAAEKPAVTVNKDAVINRQGKDFVLYWGLLDAAHRAGLTSIYTHLVTHPSATNGGTCIVHATAEFPWGSFTGIGDADDQNVSRNIAPHKIRMAETRAKARALRDALNVSMAAVEELTNLPSNDDDEREPSTTVARQPSPASPAPRPAGRRPVPPPDRETTPPPAPPPVPSVPTARSAALTKLERIQATAKRLGIKSPYLAPITDDAEADDIEVIYQRLLPLVNEALKPADSGNGGSGR